MQVISIKRVRIFLFIVCGIAFALIVGRLVKEGKFVAEENPNPAPPSRTSVYGYHNSSPHYRDETGRPYITTFELDYGMNYENAKIYYPEYITGTTLGINDPRNQGVKDALKGLIAKLYDYNTVSATEASVITKMKAINPTMTSYSISPSWGDHLVGDDTWSVNPISFNQYLNNKYPNRGNPADPDYLAYEGNFLHSTVKYICQSGTTPIYTILPWDSSKDTNNDGVVDDITGLDPNELAFEIDQSRVRVSYDCGYFHANLKNQAFKDSMVDYTANVFLPATSQDGVFWDSAGVTSAPVKTSVEYGDDSTLDWWTTPYFVDNAALYSLLNPLFVAAGKTLVENGANVYPDNSHYAHADKVGGILWEHFQNNEWTGDDMPIQKAQFLNNFQANYPNTKLITQYGTYGETDYYKDWAPCKSKNLAERMQTASLAAFYISKKSSSGEYNALYDTPYDYAAQGCNDEYGFTGGAFAPWLHSEVGNLPKSVSYDIGQPVGDQPTGAYATVTFEDLKWNNHGGYDPDDVSSSIYKRAYQYGDAYYRPSYVGLKTYINNGVNLDTAKQYINEKSLLKSDGSTDFPLDLGGQKCVLKNDGSIIGPISQLNLYVRDGAILVPCSVKTGDFVESTFDLTKSTTTWWADTATKRNTFVNFDALTDDEMTTENLTTRPAQITLVRNVGDGQSVSIAYDNKLSLNPAKTYDLDNGSAFAPNKASIYTDALPEFDAPATIAFTGVTFKDPVILKNGAECGATCQISKNTAGEFSFHVNGFSAYEVMEKVTTPTSGDNGTGYTDPYPTKKVAYSAKKKTVAAVTSSPTAAVASTVEPTSTATAEITPIATTTATVDDSKTSRYTLISILAVLALFMVYLSVGIIFRKR